LRLESEELRGVTILEKDQDRDLGGNRTAIPAALSGRRRAIGDREEDELGRDREEDDLDSDREKRRAGRRAEGGGGGGRDGRGGDYDMVERVTTRSKMLRIDLTTQRVSPGRHYWPINGGA
jgi:hypothetical protein